MSSQQSWHDRQKIVELLFNMDRQLEWFLMFDNVIETLKTEIAADDTRKTELVNLLKEDPIYPTLAQLLTRINLYKTAADWIKANLLGA